MSSLSTLVALLPLLADVVSGQQFLIDKFLYVGKRNVLHNDTDNHISLWAGDLDSDREKVRNLCANYCTLDSECDAFFVEAKDEGNCHLVDEDLSPDLEPFVAHGWKLPNIYYVKTDADVNVGAINIAEELIPPCDLDEITLTAAECSAFPAAMLTYYECTDSSAKYADTVNLVKDAKCSGEDRLLQCEMDGREVGSNIVDKDLFNLAFIRTTFQPQGFISDGAEVVFVQMMFKNAPREITRLILRTIRSGNEHMKVGDVEVYSPGDSTPDVIDYYFIKVEACALLINFAYADVGYTRHLAAEKVTIKPESWYGFDKHGFKMDVFIKELTV